MLAMLETVPYLAFAGAGLLVAFVAGEALYKKFLSLRLGAFSAKPIAPPKPAPASKPEPEITVQNGSSERVDVLDAPLNVRISDRVEASAESQESGQRATSVEIAEQKSENSAEMEPVVSTVVTDDSASENDSERQQPVPFSVENGTPIEDSSESLDEGNLCNEVIAIRRDPSVRVFDAVVAPSERKSSAA
jgi:hypothetical protein